MVGMKPSISRTVHWVDEDKPERHLPAIVTAVNDDGSVNLQIMRDAPTGTLYRAGVHEDSAGAKKNSWHWPEMIG